MTVPRHETGEDSPPNHSEYWQREQWRQAGDEPFWAKPDVTVVAWRGQYRNDGLERLEVLRRHASGLFGLRNPRLIGSSGAWRLLVDAAPASPDHQREDHNAR